MEAVGCGVEAAVYSLSAGLEQPRELDLRGVFWERVLHNTTFIQREKESALGRRRTVKVRPECEANASSPR